MYDREAPSSKRALAEFVKPVVRAKLQEIAERITKSEADAKDLIQDAMSIVLDPEKMPWVQPDRSFLRHMSFAMAHIWHQQLRGARARHEYASEDITADEGTLSQEPPADDELHERRLTNVQRALAKEMLAEIGDAHPFATQCFHLGSQGMEPWEQAKALKVTVEEIYEGHRVLRRCGRRCLERWEESEQRRMAELRARNIKSGKAEWEAP